MSKTRYEICGQDFKINGQLTYSEIPGVNPAAKGLLFNARFIQGVFNDINPANKGVYDRFGKTFDPDENTRALIEALPAWYDAGLRAITVGLQAGGPIYSYTDWAVIETGAFSADGKEINPDTWRRMSEIIKAADEIGMLVIVSFFYQGQFQYFDGDAAAIEASKTACMALLELDYDNVIIEVANEYDTMRMHNKDTALGEHKNMAAWIRKIREWTGGRFAVGSSPAFRVNKEQVQASDLALIHGNQKRRQELHDLVRTVRMYAPDKPIVVNEDSPLFTQLEVAIDNHFSWGYYNTMTKQEPPCDWGITRGEDQYFAQRLAKVIGIKAETLPEKDVYLQGFEPEMTIDDGRYIRVAAKNPELIDRVRFYEDGKQLDIAYAEPFMLYDKATWIQEPYYPGDGAKCFSAAIRWLDGTETVLTQDLTLLPPADRNKAHKPSPFNDPTGGNASL
ncbi:MAG: hypothetical protein IJI08_00035 [Clostridia bacterium]|nr:hypothetical protein [Clostridia bacterium]